MQKRDISTADQVVVGWICSLLEELEGFAAEHELLQFMDLFFEDENLDEAAANALLDVFLEQFQKEDETVNDALVNFLAELEDEVMPRRESATATVPAEWSEAGEVVDA